MRQTRHAECFKCRKTIEELGILVKRKTRSEYKFVILHPKCAGYKINTINSKITDFIDFIDKPSLELCEDCNKEEKYRLWRFCKTCCQKRLDELI